MEIPPTAKEFFVEDGSDEENLSRGCEFGLERRFLRVDDAGADEKTHSEREADTESGIPLHDEPPFREVGFAWSSSFSELFRLGKFGF
jgi:hypothetical protein